MITLYLKIYSGFLPTEIEEYMYMYLNIGCMQPAKDILVWYIISFLNKMMQYTKWNW